MPTAGEQHPYSWLPRQGSSRRAAPLRLPAAEFLSSGLVAASRNPLSPGHHLAAPLFPFRPCAPGRGAAGTPLRNSRRLLAQRWSGLAARHPSSALPPDLRRPRRTPTSPAVPVPALRTVGAPPEHPLFHFRCNERPVWACNATADRLGAPFFEGGGSALTISSAYTFRASASVP